MQHCATCHVQAERTELCAEGTEWWKKARQKQATSKQQEPLFNEFVDEEVSVKPTLQAHQRPQASMFCIPLLYSLITAWHASA